MPEYHEKTGKMIRKSTVIEKYGKAIIYTAVPPTSDDPFVMIEIIGADGEPVYGIGYEDVEFWEIVPEEVKSKLRVINE